MSKQTEALKLALEAAEVLETLFKQAEAMHEEVTAGVNVHCQITVADLSKGLYAASAIREALAEQETVLPGGGHVPAVPVAVYGYCPECGGAGVMRERRPNGDDKCTNGHKYPSSKALAEQPAQQQKPDYHICPTCGGMTSDPIVPPADRFASKPWVGLTDDEIEAAASIAFYGYMTDKNDDQDQAFARAIEAKLREKNA